jgi:hypothetical protein
LVRVNPNPDVTPDCIADCLNQGYVFFIIEPYLKVKSAESRVDQLRGVCHDVIDPMAWDVTAKFNLFSKLPAP